MRPLLSIAEICPRIDSESVCQPPNPVCVYIDEWMMYDHVLGASRKKGALHKVCALPGPGVSHWKNGLSMMAACQKQ